MNTTNQPATKKQYNTSSKHVVVTPGTMVTFDGVKLNEENYASAGRDMADVARELAGKGFTHAWFLRGHGVILPSPDDAVPAGWERFVQRRTRTGGRALFLISAKMIPCGQPGRLHINLIMAENTAYGRDGIKWAAHCTGKELLAAILYLEKHLGTIVGAGPGAVGWNMLQQMHPEWLDNYPRIDLKEHHFTPEAGNDFWHKSPAIKTVGVGYLHKFDRSMAYPYAAKFDNRYGVGTPVHEVGNCLNRVTKTGKSRADRVGVFRCTVSTDDVRADLLPICNRLLLRTDATDAGDRWYTGPYIRALRHLGCTVEVWEGWVFPEDGKIHPHETLARWAQKMWDGRMSFRSDPQWKMRNAAKFAEAAIKTIAVATVGRTAYKEFDEETEADNMRPDIRLQTVGRSVELTVLTILGEYERSGRMPLLVYADAIYYACDEPDGRAAFPGIVKREGEFGGMKYEGGMRITEGIADALRTVKRMSDLLAVLNEKGWQQ